MSFQSAHITLKIPLISLTELLTFYPYGSVSILRKAFDTNDFTKTDELI